MAINNQVKKNMSTIFNVLIKLVFNYQTIQVYQILNWCVIYMSQDGDLDIRDEVILKLIQRIRKRLLDLTYLQEY